MISKEQYAVLMGPPPVKADYPGKKGDPAPNARFQVAKIRYEEIRKEIEKVVAVVSPGYIRVNENATLNPRQTLALDLAQQVCALLGDAVAFVVVRPTTLSSLWLCFAPESGPRFLESHNQQFHTPRPAWIPLDPIIAVPSAVAVQTASFITRSIEDGNVWILDEHVLRGLLPGPTLQKNQERLDKAAIQFDEDHAGVAELDDLGDLTTTEPVTE